MENKEKIYCGSGIGKFENNLIDVSLCLSDLPKEHVFEYNGKKYIKLKVQKKKEVDKYGKSHFVEVDTWKPTEKKEPETSDFEDVDDLPF